MKKIFTIAKKEFLDMFRDKRTLIRMILIPLLAFPAIIYLVTTIQSSQSEKEAKKEIKIGYYLNNQSMDMIDRMAETENFTFIAYADTTTIRQDVKKDSVNIGIWFSSNFDANYATGKQANYGVYYRSADDEEFSRFQKLLDKEESYFIQERLAKNSLPSDYIKPILVEKRDTSSLKEVIGKYAGGILPYIFMAFCFMGCMLPAIDLFAGEKERGTIETLLVTPVNRIHILLGKMIVVTAFGLLSATVALIGLIGSIYLMGGEGSQLSSVIAEIVTPQLVITLYVLLIPVAIFFAGIMIPVSVYSRSFKEAQSILTPLNMAVILPTMVGFLPGVELDYTTAFIPIVNVVLATKAVIAGNAEIVPLMITFLSLLILSAIAVFISFKQFGREANVLR